jgi:hypothetical protein
VVSEKKVDTKFSVHDTLLQHHSCVLFCVKWCPTHIVFWFFFPRLVDSKTLHNTEGAIQIYIPEKLGTLSRQDGGKKTKTQYVLDTTLHKIKHMNGVAEACIIGL